jgi:hypothetical protein
MNSDLSIKTEKLIVGWEQSRAARERAAATLGQLNDTLGARIEELGDWLVPDDAHPGETFSVWWGSRLISVKAPTQNTREYTISIRTGRTEPEIPAEIKEDRQT